MNTNNKSDRLIIEEQKILTNLVDRMDNEILNLDERLTRIMLEAKKAIEQCLPDTYGDLLQAEGSKADAKDRKKYVEQIREELYDHRITLEIDDQDGMNEIEDLKIGLHTYAHGSDVFVCSWLRPVCRHYLLDNTAKDFEGKVVGKHGEIYITKYLLKQKCKVDLKFTKVKDVNHLYPALSDEDDVIADEFLKELLERRSGQEFKNIVFSIQKQQGYIIQTPFRQNIIVQGCAGSGKSMIMLHRLPILLYDNPNILDRKNLYIITPSQAYIQMAENMRYQLEIADLNMGTLVQYYNYTIEKYGRKPTDYGKISPSAKLTEEQEKYLYSKACISDINTEMENAIERDKFDYEEGINLFSLDRKNQKTDFPKDRIMKKSLECQSVLTSNLEMMRFYYRIIKDTVAEVDGMRILLQNRKTAVIRGINKKIAEEEKEIVENLKELEKLDEKENEIAVNNRKLVITNSKRVIIDLSEIKSEVETNKTYFSKIDKFKNELDEVLSVYEDNKKTYEEHTWQEIYSFISKIKDFVLLFEVVVEEISEIEELYSDFTFNIFDELQKTKLQVDRLKVSNRPFLLQDYYQKLLDASAYYKKLSETLPLQVYLSIMKKFGQEPNKKGNINAFNDSPYLYIQVLYQFQGVPNSVKEGLITIDEAQSLAPEEIALIRNTNNNQVTLNLFGDEKQHIEGTKGIDKWSEIFNFSDFKQYNMQENYRNARQITDYCNRRFHMKMNAINLDGSGVHEYKNFTTFSEDMKQIFLKVQNKGICAIVVKDKAESIYILRDLIVLKDKIYNMIDEHYDIHRERWNIMTVEQAKGLEFGSVIAISGRMTENEKYITYTRALDELFVFDKLMEISEWKKKTRKKTTKMKKTNQKET